MKAAMRSRDRPPGGPRALAILALVGTVLTVSSCSGGTSNGDGDAQPTPGSDTGGVSTQPAPGEPASSPSEAGAVPPADPEGEASAAPAPDAPASTGTSGPDAATIAASVEATMRALAETEDTVTRDQVRSAIDKGFADAGASPEALEVSIDRTPTGLDVDAIQGSGLVGGRCIVGEIREGAVSVTVLPVLATGLCFVGDQR